MMLLLIIISTVVAKLLLLQGTGGREQCIRGRQDGLHRTSEASTRGPQVKTVSVWKQTDAQSRFEDRNLYVPQLIARSEMKSDYFLQLPHKVSNYFTLSDPHHEMSI